jgi:hypothetical protein
MPIRNIKSYNIYFTTISLWCDSVFTEQGIKWKPSGMLCVIMSLSKLIDEFWLNYVLMTYTKIYENVSFFFLL